MSQVKARAGLLFALFLEVQRGIEVTERDDRFRAEHEQLLHVSADAAIRDRREQLGESCVLGTFGVQTTSIRGLTLYG